MSGRNNYMKFRYGMSGEIQGYAGHVSFLNLVVTKHIDSDLAQMSIWRMGAVTKTQSFSV